MNIELSSRTAIVIGGSRNTGLAVALALAASGARVGVTYAADETQAKAACELAEVAGSPVTAAAAVRLEHPESVRGGISALTDQLGGADILVSCAAIRPQRKTAELSVEDWDTVMGANVRGPFVACQAVLPGMISRNFGRIILFGGISAHIGQHNRTHVMSSKFAIIGLARALAYETAQSGVTVNTVIPGTLDTRRGDAAGYGTVPEDDKRVRHVPAGRLGRPEEVGALCCFLASDFGGYVTGQELFVTGGVSPLVRRGTE